MIILLTSPYKICILKARELTILLLIIFAFAVPDFSYLYWRLASGPWDALYLSLPFLLLASFPFKNIHRYQRKLIYLSLGVITYLTLMTLIRDVFMLITHKTLSPLWVYAGTMLFILGGTLHAWLGPHVKRVQISVKDLHSDLENFTIAQISDLHIGPTIRKKYVQKVVEKTNALNASIIALTGDIGDGPVKQYQNDIQPLSKLHAQFGTFYVTGNHEYYWNGMDWINVMNDVGMNTLINRAMTVKVKEARVLVAGIPDPVSRVTGDIAVMGQNTADFKVLLSHRPGIAKVAEASGFDLQLSGHTHGGQFFPWTIVVKFVHEFSRGLGRLNKMWVYVNVGTGSWGPFLRVGSTTEITLLELVKE